MGQIIKTGTLKIDSLPSKQLLGSSSDGSIIDSGITITGTNTGDETTASILSKLGISNISGSNTGDNATNSQYSGLAASKQDTLVSTTNIKSINGNSILGSGDLIITVTGGVVGPAISTDNAIARYDLTTGQLIQDSDATINDSGEITTPGLFIDCDSDSNSSQFSYGYGYDPSIAEYYNKRFRIDSFLESPFFSAGVARNYLLQSEVLATTWANTGGTLTSNDATLLAPNGSATAEKIIARAGYPTDNILQTITNTAVGFWSAGIWARTISGTSTITLEIYSNTEAGTPKTVNVDTKWRFFAVKQELTTAHANKTFKITYGETSIQLWAGRMNPGETCNAYNVRTTSALTTATPGIFFNSTPVYATTFSGSLSGNASSATTSTYSIGGNYGSTTLSNTTDNSAKWELLGTLTLSYNATYSYGQSINQVINLSEYSESEAAKASANYEDIYLTIKGTLAAASGNSATFNSNEPTLSMTVSGTSTLTGNDFAILVFSTSTTSKVLRVYAKLKNPNTHYIVNPITYGNLSYSSALTPSISYITWTSASQTAVLAALPTPAQGSVVNATLVATGGDTISPAANTADYIPQWNGVNSKTLKDGLAVPAGGLAGITALDTKAANPMTTTGDLIVASNTATPATPARVAAVALGSVLTSKGTGTLPAWDSAPQITSINLGHASDTTLSRGAAGFLAVESKRVPSPASQASGDVLYRGATEWERLAKGTAGQVLTMNSGATAPEWAAATSGGTTVYKTVKLGTQADGDDNKTFSLSTGSWSDSKYLMVFLNGVLQEDGAGSDYTLIDTNTIEFVNIVDDTDKITMRVQQ